MELPQQSKYQLKTTVDNNEIPQNITHGYAGLRNQGSTCYLNAVLQTLFMTEEFRNAVESSQDENGLSSELAHLFKDLKSGKKSVTTENITDVLNIGNVNEQQDAEKWFLKILNMVSSDVSKTFQGIMEYTTICRNEHTSMVQTDHCFSLDISMESRSPINVQYCFDSLFEPVSMCGEDQIYCTTCKNMMNMETNCKIKKCPPVLVLHLERFELDYNTMYYRKNTSRVEIPLQLSVKGEEEVRQYDLYAVVKHTGSLRSGHYFADIKSFEDKKWYRFNDCSVHMIPDLKDQKACHEAYLLLYKSGLLLSASVTPEQGNGRAKSTEVNQEPEEGKMSQTKTSLEEKNPSEPDHQPQPSEIHPQNQSSEDNHKNPETVPNALEAAADANEAGLWQSKSVTPEQDNGKSCETEDNQEPTGVKMSCTSEDLQTKTSLEEKNPYLTNVPPVPDHQPQPSEVHPQNHSSEDANKNPETEENSQEGEEDTSEMKPNDSKSDAQLKSSIYLRSTLV